MCFFVPESKRVHGIIKCVISPDKMTSTPSKIISSSVNNLTVWDGERARIPYSFHFFGIPCRYRIPHIYQEYDNKTQPLRPYFFCWIAIAFA
jgi:hypothetical protein